MCVSPSKSRQAKNMAYRKRRASIRAKISQIEVLLDGVAMKGLDDELDYRRNASKYNSQKQ